MNRAEYRAYLKSPWWRARRTAVIKYRGAQCERCWSSDQLQLHHRTYARLGHEHPDDVELLCRQCHMAEHGISQETTAAEPDRWLPSRLDYAAYLEQFNA